MKSSGFFFQAEDGIRDKLVTGVQTCALPISSRRRFRHRHQRREGAADRPQGRTEALLPAHGVHGPRTVYASAESARQASRARNREGGLGHAAQDHTVAAAREADAEGVCRSRASARGAAAGAACRRGGQVSSGITPELRWHAIGRRKLGIARVYLTPGSGKWSINGRTLGDYFPRPSLVSHIQQPFTATDTLGAFDVKARVVGGGLTGQAGGRRRGVRRAAGFGGARTRQKTRGQRVATRDSRAGVRKEPRRAGG